LNLPNYFNNEIEFLINQNLNIRSANNDIHCKKNISGLVPLKICRARLQGDDRTLSIEYDGIINYPLSMVGREYDRGYEYTPGMISSNGVYLGKDSYWYPVISSKLVTFTLSVEVPDGWEAISQGERIYHKNDNSKTFISWRSLEPQEEIVLTANRLFEYSKKYDDLMVMIFLKNPDRELANRYIEATIKYIKMYEKLLGRYPYKKFALVENFWESGFGMPSFTLLGSKIIRFPFIIDSSYPHEILHNWFGNSIYLDSKSGNWTEGLTAYLSDHLIREQQGTASEYRMSNLQKYADYVISEKEFPLGEFKQRYSSSSEAIGYGKSMMFFHMLRLELGDDKFIAGLKRFYNEKIFSFASFDDLKSSFEKVSNRNLDKFFRQWIDKKGAPEIRLKSVTCELVNKVYSIKIVIEQIQDGEPFVIRLPVYIYLEGEDYAHQEMLTIENKISEFIFNMSSKPIKIEVDPEFDVFRRLDRREIPPALSQILGANSLLVVLPSSLNKDIHKKVSMLFSKLAADGVKVISDKSIEKLSDDSSIVILGWDNSLLRRVNQLLLEYNVKIGKDSIEIDGNTYQRKGITLVTALKNPYNLRYTILFVGTEYIDSLRELMQKLSHYHKYSYLVFEGGDFKNILKGSWKIKDSPLSFNILTGNNDVVRAFKLRVRRPLVEVQM